MKYLLSSSKIITILILSAGLIACGKTGNGNKEQPEGRQLDYSAAISFISSASGDTLSRIEAAVADDQEERNAGLMDVRSLPADKGMIFIFENEGPLSFWMANTPLALDIIFVNKDMEIVRIHRNTTPFSEQSYVSGEDALYTVEVNGGYTVNYDINEGDRIELQLDQVD
jgi:hypothetical protein